VQTRRYERSHGVNPINAKKAAGRCPPFHTSSRTKIKTQTHQRENQKKDGSEMQATMNLVCQGGGYATDKNGLAIKTKAESKDAENGELEETRRTA